MSFIARLGQLRIAAATNLSVVTVLFVALTSGFGQYTSLVQRPLFLLLVLALGYVLFPRRGAPSRLATTIDTALALGSLVACLIVIVRADEIATSLPEATTGDVVALAVLLVGMMVLMQRLVGWAFPAMVAIALLYALFGRLIPGSFGHRGLDLAFLTETLYLGDLGLWGMLTGVAATTIAPFVLFGSMVLSTGGGQTFMDLAMRVSGRSPGGAAKMAIVASGLFGMISGSAVANVATTGNLTIPLMMRLGYPARLAGAVEAVASTGGQLAPPIMGAAAFVMAELVGVGYLAIATAAVLPALLFYFSIFLIIHQIAVRWKLPLVPAEDMPPWAEALDLRRLAPLVVGLVVLVTAVFLGRSVAFSATAGTAALLVVFLALNIRSGSDVQDCLERILAGARDAGLGFVTITVLLAGAQILVAVINVTGIGVTMSSFIVTAFSGMPLLAPVVVALACLVLGMGVPTTAAYILVAAILAPAMIRIGFEPMATHLFVLYFAALSAITPPVCVAVFVAAGISKSPWLTMAVQSMRLSSVIYLLPFAFLFMPGLLGEGGPLVVAESTLRAILATRALTALISGDAFSRWRGLAVPAQVVLLATALFPSPYALAAACVVAAILWWPSRSGDRGPKTSLASAGDDRREEREGA